jgi:hypothetical protein
MEIIRNGFGKIRQRKWLVLSFVCLLLISSVWLDVFRDELEYNGKALSEWVDQLLRHPMTSEQSDEVIELPGLGFGLADKEAAEAISHLGPKVLPDLLHMMEARNNRLNGFLSKLETKMFNGKTPRYSIVKFCRAPTMAIALFYEQAGIIRTDLEQLTKDGNPAVRDMATMLLEWIDRHDD